MAIHIKAFEQCFPVVLFIVLQNVVLLLSLWLKSQSVTIQLKASEHSFPVLLFIILYKVVLIFQFVDEVPLGELALTSTRAWFFRLAESYSQLVKYYLDNTTDVDKRLNWQVKKIVWKGKE